MADRISRLRLAAAGALLALSFVATAQDFPSRKITLIVPFAPGGPTDVVSRAVMQEAEKKWGQAVIIENRPGASGLAAVDYFARQPADGYTLFFHGNTPLTAHFFMKSIPYNPSDLRPLAAFGGSSYVITVHPSLGVKTLKEAVALAKAKPKSINYGTINLTSYELDHYVLFGMMGIEMTPVPYQSAAPIATALLRGDVQYYLAIVSLVKPHIDAGKLVPLAYLGESRHPQFPTVPTVKEEGYDFSTGYVLGVYAHAKTPAPIFDRLGRDLDAAVKTSEVAERLAKVGYQAYPAPRDWQTRIDRELKLYGEVVRKLNYQPQ